MPTSYIWDSGQEITGVQGVVAGGVQFVDFLTGAVGGGGASCRRGRRKGEGDRGSTVRAAGLDFFRNRKKSRSALDRVEDGW